ncbi:alpha/beta hydrolase [Phenylobacterium sp.]|uniref:alpha/beta fold hydrolase n=1 Tax=Phenylobacterium sp. TaxID=1871053 RepID=UPI00301C10AD
MPAGRETRIEAQTPFGPVWFRARDTGRPVLLFVSGAFAPVDNVANLQDLIPGADVWRAHLPGNHAPPLIGESVGLFVAAFDAAVRAALGDRPVVAAGNSTGALVAMGLKAPNIRRLVLIEPPLRITPGGPFESMRGDPRFNQGAFIDNIFGVGPRESTPRDYSHLLAALGPPAHVLIGGPPEPGAETGPSVVDDLTRADLQSHPRVRLYLVRGAGHQVLPHAPETVAEVMNRACREAFG